MDQPQSEEDFKTRSFLEKCLKGSPRELLRAVPRRRACAVEAPRGLNLVVKRSNSAWKLRRQARRKFAAISARRALGISVLPRLAYIERGGGSLLAMEQIWSGATPREALATTSAAEPERRIGRLLELVLSLYSAGWDHRDLHLHHILVDSRGELVLSERERLRFLISYMNEMEMLNRGERRRFIMDVLLRRERMARPRPRHGESAEWGPAR